MEFGVGEMSSKNIRDIKLLDKKMIKECKNASENGVELIKINTQYYYLKYVPDCEIYKDQIHIIEIKMIYGSSPHIYIYPFSPPLCRFMTNIWHPNISVNGTICVDTLKEEWSPSTKIISIIGILNGLLINPNPNSPLNREAADMLGDKKQNTLKVSEYYNRPTEKLHESISAAFNL